VLGRAKASARGTACLNNIRQLGVASVVYSGDTGRFPSFLDWLSSRGQWGDLTSGKLYPYLKTKAVYLCPTDKVEVEPREPEGPAVPVRQHSYLMNCMMCHARDVTACLSPAQSLMFVEGTNLMFIEGPNLTVTLASSLVPPSEPSPVSPVAFRHGGRAHLLMTDIHVEKMNRKQFDKATTIKRFWYPNEQTGRWGGL
jgi:hypothetical protein